MQNLIGVAEKEFSTGGNNFVKLKGIIEI